MELAREMRVSPGTAAPREIEECELARPRSCFLRLRCWRCTLPPPPSLSSRLDGLEEAARRFCLRNSLRAMSRVVLGSRLLLLLLTLPSLLLDTSADGCFDRADEMGTVGTGVSLRFEGEGERLAALRGEFDESSCRAPAGTLGSCDTGDFSPSSLRRVEILSCSGMPGLGSVGNSFSNGALRFLSSSRFTVSS